MNHSVKIACLACLATLVFPSGAFAQLGGGKGAPGSAASATGTITTDTVSCTVTAINISALTFACSSGSGKATFAVDAATVFSPAGSTLNSLKVGAAAQVSYHAAGNVLQADSVSIQ